MVLEHGDYLTGQHVVPRMPPPKRGKKGRLQARKSPHDYVLVDLSRRTIEEQNKPRPATTPTGRSSPYLHDVSGFIKGVWRLDPQGRPVRAERVREDGKTLYKVAKWIPPYTRGDPTKEAPQRGRRRKAKVVRRRRKR
jgi:hypothetical protein